MFQIRGAIIRPLPRTDPNLIFVQLGSQEFTVLKYIAKLKLLELKWITYTAIS